MKYLCLLFCLSGLCCLCAAQEPETIGETTMRRNAADRPALHTVSAASDSLRYAVIDRRLEALVERDSTFARTVDVTAGGCPSRNCCVTSPVRAA